MAGDEIRVTGKTGPGRDVVDHVLPNATTFAIDLKKKILTVGMTTRPEGGSDSRDIDLVGITSVEFNVVDGTYKINAS